MSNWRTTGRAGWDEETGEAIYHVTKGSKSLNAGDHRELEALLRDTQERHESAKRMAAALSDLTMSMARDCQDGMTELSDSFCEARQALSDWRALKK